MVLTSFFLLEAGLKCINPYSVLQLYVLWISLKKLSMLTKICSKNLRMSILVPRIINTSYKTPFPPFFFSSNFIPNPLNPFGWYGMLKKFRLQRKKIMPMIIWINTFKRPLYYGITHVCVTSVHQSSSNLQIFFFSSIPLFTFTRHFYLKGFCDMQWTEGSATKRINGIVKIYFFIPFLSRIWSINRWIISLYSCWSNAFRHINCLYWESVMLIL